MNSQLKWLEEIFKLIPLPALEVWGMLGYLIGLVLMFLAFGGVIVKPGSRWNLAVFRQTWDEKSLQSFVITFLLICFTGYLGSFFVLVPEAQTFESLKDLAVFVCILIFGYPALIAVPFAYGISDLVEGIPPEFLRDWLVGYFINPACFWVAYQLFGKNPDFKKSRTWWKYLLFVFIFLSIEPALWGHICAGKFTASISYRTITPALFLTTSITWILAPFAMLAIFPLARKFNLFWCDISGHVKERGLFKKEWEWESGLNETPLHLRLKKSKLPIRMLLVTPFIVVVFIIVGSTAYFTLQSSADASHRLASHLHKEITENIGHRLNYILETTKVKNPTAHINELSSLLDNLANLKHGRAFIIDQTGKLITSRDDLVVKNAVKDLKQNFLKLNDLHSPVQFHFDIITAKPLSRETWLAQATPLKGKNGLQADWILVSALPESYYMAGVRKGNSQSAMVIAVALLASLGLAALLGTFITEPIIRLSNATEGIEEGNLALRVPGSNIEEMDNLSSSFNKMAEKLQNSFDQIKINENRLSLATKSASIGIWDWDIENNVVIWDESMYPLYDLDKESFGHDFMAWENHLLPEDRQRSILETQAVLRGEKEFDTEFRVQWRDGSIHTLRGVAKMFRNEEGKPVRMVGINYDITDKKRSEEILLRNHEKLEELVKERTANLLKINQQLETSIKTNEELANQLRERERLAALGFMSAGLAHEIKNPLNLICNAAEINLLQLEKLSNLGQNADDKSATILSKLKESNQIIVNNGYRVDNIVKTLLLQVRKTPDSFEQNVDIIQLVRTNLDFVLSNYRSKINNRLNIEINTPGNEFLLVGNPIDLGRVFINVLDNSCYAMIKKINGDSNFQGNLCISFAHKDKMVEIKIKDNGIGIKEQNLSQVFTPFFTSKLPGEGTGLGLNFAKEIVKQHGGEIEVASQEEVFTEITITLPLFQGSPA